MLTDKVNAEGINRAVRQAQKRQRQRAYGQWVNSRGSTRRGKDHRPPAKGRRSATHPRAHDLPYGLRAGEPTMAEVAYFDAGFFTMWQDAYGVRRVTAEGLMAARQTARKAYWEART